MGWVLVDGAWTTRWFRVPEGQCWLDGSLSVDGKCVYCGFSKDQHEPVSECTLTKKKLSKNSEREDTE
jgi:hypothetical protein